MGDENEFYGPEPWIIAQNGPIENQTYRFFVSSMRALQMRRNYVSTRKPGLDYLRGQNDEYRSAEFIDYLTKVFGRTRFDTPDAFVLLGERTLSTFSGLYPNEYKSSNTSESCLIQGEARGVTTVNQFGRWLSLKSSSVRDTSMSKDLTGWTQIINGQPYELYARKSNKMDFDINDQLIQARCSSGCDIEVKVSFKDDRPMTLVVNHSGGSETLTTQGGGFTRTATFPISGSFTNSLGANQHDFNVETTDGSDLSVIMVRVNFMSNQVNATPAIPMTVSPSGDVSEGDVVFTWKPVAGATEYKVSFNNAGNYDAGIYKSAVELNCSTGICRQTIQGFVPGSSSWWVRSRNTTGESGWSTTSNFTVIQLQAPTTPTALSPNGTTTAGNVTFSWNPVLGATEYNVSYNNAGNYDPGTYKSASALGCSSGTCRYTEYGLVAGSSTWWVRAKNTLGETGWSNTGNFTVSSPSAPTVIGPDNVNTGGNVTFTWYPTEGAIEYNVIYSNAGNNIDVGYKDANDLDCASRTCRLSVFGLAAGASSWKVRAKSTAGESDWTDTKTFTVTVPSAPTTIGPDNATAGGDVEFTWYPTFGATEYSVSYNNAGNYVVTDYKSAIEMDCSSGYCRYIATNLAAGSTDWWVKARSSAGESGWADTKTFTVAIPSTPTIIGPNNINTGNYVTFSWYPTAGAYEYNVSYNNAGTYTPGVYGGANDYNCSSGICSYTVGPLLEGNSTWWIRAKNSIGESSWSDTTSFIAGPPISPTAISPINTTAGSNVTFNWYPVAGAMEYIVSFNNAGSYNPGSYKTANELGCSSGQCSLSLGGLEAGSTDWWIRAKNSYGESGWSNTKTFVSSGQ